MNGDTSQTIVDLEKDNELLKAAFQIAVQLIDEDGKHASSQLLPDMPRSWFCTGAGMTTR